MKLLKPVFNYIETHLKKAFVQEILATIIISITLFWHAQSQDLFEQIVSFSQAHEEYELDEVLVLLMIASLGCLFIIYRRTNYLKKEILRRKEAEQKIKSIALHDSLTGLANRDLCALKLEKIVSNAKAQNYKVAVLFIDIDNFKGINDSFGHSCGDKLLQQVARRLSEELKDKDVIARISGDEFVVIIDKFKGIDCLNNLLNRLLTSIENPFVLNKSNAYIGLSIGVSLYPSNGSDTEKLLKRADTAMYQAKSDGKNTFKYFSKSMEEKANRRSRISQNIQRAIERNELSIVYQPILNNSTNNIRGAEALVRWNNPELGAISPNEFIPIAEETGMISAIDEWVLLGACKQNKQWLDEGLPPIVMSVNISAVHLNSDKIVRSLTRTLKQSELPPSLLELEVTETAVMKDVDNAIKSLEKLKDTGVSISLDDFGTGYSSMSYLRSFKLDRIKIDQSFLKNIPSNKEDVLLANTIITLGNNLSLKVTAEGIETSEQLHFIQSTCCDSIQGFYFSKPVDANAFKEMLNNQ